MNLLIDQSEKKYRIGFSWPKFNASEFGLPAKFQIDNLFFGLSLDFNPNSKNTMALKIGGHAFFGDGKDEIFLEYERDNKEQRLEFGCTLSVLSTILGKMSVDIPKQLNGVMQDSSITFEWVSDVGNKLADQMK